MSTRLGFDSNIFSREDETEAGAVRFEALGRISDRLERASYSVTYRPDFFVYTNSLGNSAMNHRVVGDGEYAVTPRWKLGVANTFSRQERIRQETVEEAEETAGTLITDTVALRSNYSFSQRLHGSTQVTRSFYRQDRGNRQDNDHFGGRVSLNYVLSPRARVGFGGNVGYRWFDERKPLDLDPLTPSGLFFLPCQPAPPGTRSLNYQVFGSFNYQLSRESSLSLSGGPAEIRTSRYQCETDPNSPADENLFGPGVFNLRIARVDDSSFTWFASAKLQQEWQKFTAEASFQRSEGLSGDSQNTSINSTASTKVRWTVSRLWNVSFSGSWSLSESEGRGLGTQETVIWRADSKIRRRLSERARVSLSFSYTNRANESGVVRTSDSFETYRVFLGVDYKFAPIRF